MLPGMKCDFCSAPNATHGYWTPDHVMQAGINEQGQPFAQVSRGGWAACDECAALIEARDREGLIERAVTEIPKRQPALSTQPRAFARAVVVQIHGQFWALLGKPPAE